MLCYSLPQGYGLQRKSNHYWRINGYLCAVIYVAMDKSADGHHVSLFPLFAAVLLLSVSCGDRQSSYVTVPWGSSTGDTSSVAAGLTLSDLQTGGEMIMLTVSGPDTYYDYRGRGMGVQFLLCERFAQSIGVGLRVELCRDTSEVVRRLKSGDGDVAVIMMTAEDIEAYGLLACGVAVDSLALSWAVAGGNVTLAEALDAWYEPRLLAAVRQEINNAAGLAKKRTRVYATFVDRKGGVISRYDALFRRYAPECRWDWRLLAAVCCQESAFDPRARSWAGACGLMQIMPATAATLDLPMDHIFDPEANIAASVRYISRLNTTFSDITDATERRSFVLAAYNGGADHVRDAMALTRRQGGNERRWADVERRLLLLQEPRYYNDPVVKHGYMRAEETVGYVSSIRRIYAQYRGVPSKQ